MSIANNHASAIAAVIAQTRAKANITKDKISSSNIDDNSKDIMKEMLNMMVEGLETISAVSGQMTTVMASPRDHKIITPQTRSDPASMGTGPASAPIVRQSTLFNPANYTNPSTSTYVPPNSNMQQNTQYSSYTGASQNPPNVGYNNAPGVTYNSGYVQPAVSMAPPGNYVPQNSGSYIPPNNGAYVQPNSGNYVPPSINNYVPPSTSNYVPPNVGSYVPPNVGTNYQQAQQYNTAVPTMQYGQYTVPHANTTSTISSITNSRGSTPINVPQNNVMTNTTVPSNNTVPHNTGAALTSAITNMFSKLTILAPMHDTNANAEYIGTPGQTNPAHVSRLTTTPNFLRGPINREDPE